MDKCKRGRKTPEDEERSGWPSTSRRDYHCAEVNALIKENRRISVSEIE
jgi:hypothetical protein